MLSRPMTIGRDHAGQPENHQKTRISQKTARKLGTASSPFLRENPSASRREIAGALAGVTEGSVRYRLDKLKEVGRLRRVGPDRGGRWEVIEDPDVEASEHDDGGCRRAPRPWERAVRNQPENRQKNRQKTTRKPPETAIRHRNPRCSPTASSYSSDGIPSASRREIAATLGTTRSTVRYRLDRLREAGKIERVGPDKGGHWKVLPVPHPEPGPSR